MKKLILAFLTYLIAFSSPLLAREINNPKEYTETFRKIRCSLKDGETIVSVWDGNLYSRVQGEKDRHLFKVVGMNIMQCGTVYDEKKRKGYKAVSREVMLYLDPKTGKPLSTWKNPWTGEKVKVLHVANDPVNSRPDFGYDRSGKPKTLTLKDLGSVWGFAYEIPLFYTNTLGGKYQDYVGNKYHAMEIFDFFVDKRALRSRAKSIDFRVAWVRISQWLPWMKMGTRNGILIANAQGHKAKNYDALPEVLKEEIKKNYPIYQKPPPLDDKRRNETSWTVFKKAIDESQKKK